MKIKNTDKEEDQQSIMETGFTVKTYNANVYHFYLSEFIESPSNYHQWFDIIRSCDENSIVYLHINCYGGDTFTTIQFLRCMRECSGTIIASVEGACMSGATFIFMKADIMEISNHSMFMFHNYSGGAIGKGGEMFDAIVHERDWSRRLLEDTYGGFLTESEIQSMLEGKDIYMDNIQVVERLRKMGKEVIDERDEIEEEEEDAPRKKRTPAKKGPTKARNKPTTKPGAVRAKTTTIARQV